MNAAKAKGKRIGRPPIKKYQIEMAKKLKSKGVHWKDIVKKAGISKSTYYIIVEKGEYRNDG